MTTYAYEMPRLWLQKLTPEDHLDDYHEMWSFQESLIWVQFPPLETREEARTLMRSQLPSPGNPDIDKFAILLRPVEENPKPWINAQGKPKMIGMTGTNRWSDQGMETGYFMNFNYWGRGYAGEAFTGFLKLFWSLEGRKWVKQLVAKVDPGNVASQKIVVRSGAREGEVLKGWYSRAIDNGVKRDIGCWYYDRPGAGREELEMWGKEVKMQMAKKRELEDGKARVKRLEQKYESKQTE